MDPLCDENHNPPINHGRLIMKDKIGDDVKHTSTSPLVEESFDALQIGEYGTLLALDSMTLSLSTTSARIDVVEVPPDQTGLSGKAVKAYYDDHFALGALLTITFTAPTIRRVVFSYLMGRSTHRYCQIYDQNNKIVHRATLSEGNDTFDYAIPSPKTISKIDLDFGGDISGQQPKRYLDSFTLYE